MRQSGLRKAHLFQVPRNRAPRGFLVVGRDGLAERQSAGPHSKLQAPWTVWGNSGRRRCRWRRATSRLSPSTVPEYRVCHRQSKPCAAVPREQHQYCSSQLHRERVRLPPLQRFNFSFADPPLLVRRMRKLLKRAQGSRIPGAGALGRLRYPPAGSGRLLHARLPQPSLASLGSRW
jgi:hypothetical protein